MKRRANKIKKKGEEMVYQKKSQEIESKKDALKKQIFEIGENFKENPEHVTEFLRFGSQFHPYSERNMLLIYSQNKYTEFCASYKKWKDLGYQVKAGQKGISILVPVNVTLLEIDGKEVPLSKAGKKDVEKYKKGEIEGKKTLRFKAGTVFDIGQTTFPPEKLPLVYGVGKPSADHKELAINLEKYCTEKLKLNVETKELSSVTLKGYYDFKNEDIVINSMLEDTGKLSTLTHELGHALMKHSPIIPQNTAQQEFEADALSVMLHEHVGLEIPNSRKDHLKEHFTQLQQSLENEKKPYEITDIFSNVFEVYKANIDEINQYLEVPNITPAKMIENIKNQEIKNPGVGDLTGKDNFISPLGKSKKKDLSIEIE